MSSALILGQLHPDMACAIALAIVEDSRVVANLEGITLHDVAMRPLGTHRGWLEGNDPLIVATREYMRAKREATMTTAPRPGQSGWGAASAAKTRDTANARAREARDRGRALLAESGILAHARQTGLKLVGAE
jgi:hypothetical protein